MSRRFNMRFVLGKYYVKAKDLVVNVANDPQISSFTTASVILFAKHTKSFGLSKPANESDFEVYESDDLSTLGTRRSLYHAIEDAANLLKTDDKACQSKLIVLLTFGGAADEKYETIAVKALNEEDIHLFIVGVPKSRVQESDFQDFVSQLPHYGQVYTDDIEDAESDLLSYITSNLSAPTKIEE